LPIIELAINYIPPLLMGRYKFENLLFAFFISRQRKQISSENQPECAFYKKKEPECAFSLKFSSERSPFQVLHPAVSTNLRIDILFGIPWSTTDVDGRDVTFEAK